MRSSALCNLSLAATVNKSLNTLSKNNMRSIAEVKLRNVSYATAMSSTRTKICTISEGNAMHSEKKTSRKRGMKPRKRLWKLEKKKNRSRKKTPRIKPAFNRDRKRGKRFFRVILGATISTMCLMMTMNGLSQINVLYSRCNKNLPQLLNSSLPNFVKLHIKRITFNGLLYSRHPTLICRPQLTWGVVCPLLQPNRLNLKAYLNRNHSNNI